jgi:hypothetical protein
MQNLFKTTKLYPLPLLHEKGLLIQEIPTTFPLSKSYQISEWMLLHMEEDRKNLKSVVWYFSSIVVVESTPLARNFRKS